MNELLFLLQTCFVAASVLVAYRWGREALTALFCLLAFLSNLFLFKQMEFLGLTITCSDTYAIGCFLSLGLLQHHYGEKMARRASFLCFYLIAFCVVSEKIHVLYFPSPHDHYHGIYKELFSASPRVLISSLFTAFTAQMLSLFLQRQIKRRWPQLPHTLALFLSIALAHGYDTVLFSFLALYGIMYSLSSLIIISYGVKLISLACMAPFIALSKKFSPRILHDDLPL